MRRAALVPALLAASLAPKVARAELADDAEKLAEGWERAGAEVTRVGPTFVELGRARVLRLPPALLDGARPGCTSVALLAPRGADVSVHVDAEPGPKRRPRAGEVERSVAGTLVIVRCGAARESLARAAIEVRAARAAVEIVAADSPAPLGSVLEWLPERASGPLAPPGQAASPGPLEPAEARAARAETRARRSGADASRHLVLAPEADGSGRELVVLEEGCHRVELFAESGRRRVDVDAEARDSTNGRVLARDRSDSPDARLDVCLGESTAVELLFAGAGGPSPLLLADAHFALPALLPSRWGPQARAAVATALRRRNVGPLRGEIAGEWLGVAGVTSIPVEIEPGACYLAAVGALRGDPRSVAIGARVGARTITDAVQSTADGSAIAFCAGAEPRAEIEVEMRGGSVAWIAALFRVGERAPEAEP